MASLSFLDPSTWAWNAILSIGSSLIGSNRASKANDQAANIARDTSATNAKLFREAGDKATGYITPLLDQGKSIAAPGLQYLKTVTASNPYQLNPQQSAAMGDITKNAQRSVPFSLRGSGRTATAITNKGIDTARNAMFAQNQSRADQAANTLATQGLTTQRTAAPALANIATGNASNIAAENTGAGNVSANAATSNAQSDVDVFAQIASVIANANKDQNRPSRYSGYSTTGA